MHSSSILSLFSALTLVSAAALPSPPSHLTRRNLTEDDIIVWGSNGRMEIMNKSSFALLTSLSSPAFNLTSNVPTVYNATNLTMSITTPSKRSKVSERCSSETIFTMDPVTTFLNWDVAMSSVVQAGEASALVSVTEGYAITNSVSVGVSTDLTIVENFLSTSFSIDYSESWQSSYSAGYTFTVPAGKYGAVVSNPLTTRHSGHVDIGCIGSATSTQFQADSYSSKSYSDLAWVDGTISLCTSDTFPLNRCIGSGTL